MPDESSLVISGSPGLCMSADGASLSEQRVQPPSRALHSFPALGVRLS